MIADCDRHVAFADFRDLFPFMSLSWQKHFDRSDFMGAISDTSRHVWADDRWIHEAVDPYEPEEGQLSLLLPHQGLTANGWADPVAARNFLEAINNYGEEHWNDEGTLRTILVSPHDPAWSAGEIRRRAESQRTAAVAVPLGGPLLGSSFYDPIYDACAEAGLPVVVHPSGLEGFYRGAQPLGGGVHASAFSRHVLLPQLGESNLTSMAFEGTFEKFPALRVLVAGLGFTWLPPLLWRIDREWKTFRHDVPWVKRAPSTYLLEQVWVTTWPVAEAGGAGMWEQFGFTDTSRTRVVYGSHDPFDGDAPADIRAGLDDVDAERILGGGVTLLQRVTAGVAS